MPTGLRPEEITVIINSALRTAADLIMDRLVDDPVEPQGILSRIEHHLARLLKEQNEIANHDAQIMAARHEFMRDALVAVGNDVLACKATLMAVLEAQQTYNQTLATLAAKMLELEHGRHGDDQAGGAGREADAAQGHGQDGPGRGADRP